jgi:hypothetical protein
MGSPPLDRVRAGQAQEAEVATALPDRVLERLGGPAEGDGGVGLLTRDLDAAPLRAVHPL